MREQVLITLQPLEKASAKDSMKNDCMLIQKDFDDFSLHQNVCVCVCMCVLHPA